MSNDAVPLVSIIIPCKNAEPFLGAAIESCLAQTWPNIEIIVVENGSSDGSRATATSYRHKGVKTIYCERPGASTARNLGLQASAGKYVQFLDADDLLCPRKIELQMARLSEEPEGSTAVCGWATFRGNIEHAILADEAILHDHEPSDFLVQLWTTRTMMAPFAWLTSRDVIESAGHWSEDLSWDDDGEFFARVALKSRRIVCCNEVLGYYRRHPPGTISLSRRRDTTALKSAFHACESATRALIAHEDSTRTRLASAAKYLYFVHFAYPDVPELVMEAEKRIHCLGAEVEPRGGSVKYIALSKLIGWKPARRMQLIWARYKARLGLRMHEA
jgi:glycosyltransferase involved in cell wall biosynthesis